MFSLLKLVIFEMPTRAAMMRLNLIMFTTVKFFTKVLKWDHCTVIFRD